MSIDTVWLVGAGYWGSKISNTLMGMGIKAKVIDVKNGNSIEDINDNNPVILATPLWDHYEQAKQILSNGNDLYVEKPMAETAAQCRHLKELSNDQILMVGHIFLYHPLVTRLKELIDCNEIGRIRYIESNRLNWGIYQTKTSALLSLAPHDISIIQYLLGGQPMEVNAIGTGVNNPDQFDHITAFLDYDEGIEVKLNLSWFYPEKIRKMVIIGDKGSLIYDDVSSTITVNNGYLEGTRLIEADNYVLHNESKVSPLKLELKHFIDCCNNRTVPISDVNNSIEVMETLDRLHHTL